jgi:hypothetical protein
MICRPEKIKLDFVRKKKEEKIVRLKIVSALKFFNLKSFLLSVSIQYTILQCTSFTVVFSVPVID